MKTIKVTDKMSKEDKIIKDIDANGNGRVTKKELKDYLENKDVADKVMVGVDIGKDGEDTYVVLLSPITGNSHTVKVSKLEEFFSIMGADDTWRV